MALTTTSATDSEALSSTQGLQSGLNTELPQANATRSSNTTWHRLEVQAPTPVVHDGRHPRLVTSGNLYYGRVSLKVL